MFSVNQSRIRRRVFVCVCVCIWECCLSFRVLHCYELLGTWCPVISFTYLSPFIIYWNECCFSLHLPVISAKTIGLGPSVCLMQNNYCSLPGFITGQFCSRVIVMGMPGVGTGYLSWEVRRFLYAFFFIAVRVFQNGLLVSRMLSFYQSGRFGKALLVTH